MDMVFTMVAMITSIVFFILHQVDMDRAGWQIQYSRVYGHLSQKSTREKNVFIIFYNFRSIFQKVMMLVGLKGESTGLTRKRLI